MTRHAPPWPNWLSHRQPTHQLTHHCTVAFADCDAMGVLWHGNYLKYAEQARQALAAQLGCDIPQFASRNLFAPVVSTTTFHHSPARPGETLAITVSLYPTELCRLYHRYEITNAKGLVAWLSTDQSITDRNFNLLFEQPHFIRDLLQPPTTSA